MKRTRIGWIGLLCFSVGALTTSAHDFWVDADSFAPEPGDNITISIVGGHHFPRSERLLQNRLIRDCTVRRPDGSVESIALSEAERIHTGSVTVHATGTHVFALIIQRPQQAEPQYWCRAILIPYGTDDQADTYASNEGIEIVPGKPLSQLASGDELPLELRRDGQAIATRFTVYTENQRPQWVRSQPDAPGRLTVEQGKKYLVIANDNRQTVSLVFLAGTP